MPNSNYVKGRRKEYKIVNYLKQNGFDIVVRTAGSHSPVDIFAINKSEKKIFFIQSKPESLSENKKNKLLKESEWLNGSFECLFRVY